MRPPELILRRERLREVFLTHSTPLIVGHGPHRVLAFHGWFGSSGAWGHFPDYIDGDRFTYALLDYRGYGRRRDVTGDYTIAEISADAREAADALGWRRYSLLGHSMGGLAMQQVLADAPDRVERLVALSGVPATGAQFDDETLAYFSTAPNDHQTRGALTAFSTGARLSKTFVRRIVRESLDHSAVEAFAGYLPSFVRTDIAARVQGLPHPVKVLVGEHDPSMNEDVMRATWMKFYPNAEFEAIANAGHYAMHETPVALATLVEEFLLRDR